MALDLQSSTRAPEELGLGWLVHGLEWVATGIELLLGGACALALLRELRRTSRAEACPASACLATEGV